MADSFEFTDANFASETAEGVSLVDFWAPWCGPCRRVAPIVEELAADYAGKVKVGKLNIDDHMVTAHSLRVMSIPTLMVIKDGQPVEVMVGGSLSKSAIEARISKHL